MMRLAGLGVDLLSLARAGAFLKRHGRAKAQRLLTCAETRRWRRARFSPLAFSKFFAAKEAFFKALGRPLMGLEGFGSIEVTLLGRGRFRARRLGPAGDGAAQGRGCFMCTPEFTAAQVMVWQKKETAENTGSLREGVRP